MLPWGLLRPAGGGGWGGVMREIPEPACPGQWATYAPAVRWDCATCVTPECLASLICGGGDSRLLTGLPHGGTSLESGP